MIAYFAPVESIFGQRLGEESRLRHAIQQSIPAARFSEIGKLSFKDVFCRLELQCLHHRIKNDVEEMTIRVQDFTKTNRAPDAPTIFTKVLNFDPARFESLMNQPPEPADRDEPLLAMAKEIAARKGFNV